MNRKKLITYDDKTGEILHEKEIKSWSGFDLVGNNEITPNEVYEVLEDIERKYNRLSELSDQLWEAVRRSEQLTKEQKKEFILKVDKL